MGQEHLQVQLGSCLQLQRIGAASDHQISGSKTNPLCARDLPQKFASENVIQSNLVKVLPGYILNFSSETDSLRLPGIRNHM